MAKSEEISESRKGTPEIKLYFDIKIGLGRKFSKFSISTRYKSSSIRLILIPIIVGIILLAHIPVAGIPIIIIGGIPLYFRLKNPKRRVERIIKRAKKSFNRQKFDRAIYLSKHAIELESDNTIAMYILGASLCNSDRCKEAIGYLDDFIKKHPREPDFQFIQASCYYKMGRYDEAIQILDKIPGDFEQYLKVIRLLGACFYSQKKYGQTFKVLRKAPMLAFKLNEDLMEIYYNLGVLYEEYGDVKNALNHFKKVYGQNSKYRDVKRKIEKLKV